MNGRRLAIVVSHPTQYYSPWFRWLHDRADLALRVFYLWDFGAAPRRDPQFQTTFAWDVDLLSGYDHEFVPNVSADPGTHWRGGLDNPDLRIRLAAWRPDALLLFGYAFRTHLRAILWARLHRVPIVFRGDSHLLGRRRLPLASELALRLLYRQFAAVTYVGAANRGYFEHLGVPARRLCFAPHAVDASRFDLSRPEHRAAAASIRGSLGLKPETRVVLFAGKFVAAKQPRELLEAFLALHLPRTALVFVGDGEEKPVLLDAAKAAAPAAVHFLPFANQSEMPALYLAADVFALPSRGVYETWGLAVNEAMHMGVPALVSDRVGCQRDLVTDGVTGWVFGADHSHTLCDSLHRALSAELPPIRAAALERIRNYTYAQTTAGLLTALEACRPSPAR